MYRVHVKIAFLIYMRELHDIDIRDVLNGKRVGTKPDDHIQDHHVFVISPTAEIPTEIKFVNKSLATLRPYSSERLMLQSRVKIKAFKVSTSNKPQPSLREAQARVDMRR